MVITINGTELTAINVVGSSQHYQGQNRKTLEFHFAADATDFAQLNTLFGNGSGSITITDESGTYQHDNYALRVSTALKSVVVEPETDETPEVTEERYVVVVAQKTYAEKQMEAVIDQLELIDGALFDLIINFI